MKNKNKGKEVKMLLWTQTDIDATTPVQDTWSKPSGLGKVKIYYKK